MLSLLLRMGLRHAVVADNSDDALGRIAVLAGEPIDAPAFHAALAEALAEGLILDPVVLPQGALQCHWRLHLTPAGVARARELMDP